VFSSPSSSLFSLFKLCKGILCEAVILKEKQGQGPNTWGPVVETVVNECSSLSLLLSERLLEDKLGGFVSVLVLV